MYIIVLLLLIVILYIILQRQEKEHFDIKSNLFFIHIPKNAGSSINKHFKNKYNIQYI